MRIIKFTEYLYESIDLVLDKINSVGYDELSTFEKFILRRCTDTDKIDDCLRKWFDYNYSDLNEEAIKRKSFGREMEYIIYKDSNGDDLFEYCKKYKILYASYEDITSKLLSYYNENVIMDWFEDKYNIKIERMSNFFTNR